jgi:hypothetical protein
MKDLLMKQQKQNNNHERVNNDPFYAQLERNNAVLPLLEDSVCLELTARHARHHAAEVVELIGGLVE